jgi:hypothetical protein
MSGDTPWVRDNLLSKEDQETIRKRQQPNGRRPAEFDALDAWDAANLSPERLREIEAALAEIRAEGRMIDPATAEVFHERYSNFYDFYSLYGRPRDLTCGVRASFARRPGGKIWVEFSDLPAETAMRIRTSDP